MSVVKGYMYIMFDTVDTAISCVRAFDHLLITSGIFQGKKGSSLHEI